jgi:hypothetical protein
VRLVNGTTYNEGRIEIFHSNEWGSICDNTFNEEDGQVVCRMLGLDMMKFYYLIWWVFSTQGYHPPIGTDMVY